MEYGKFALLIETMGLERGNIDSNLESHKAKLICKDKHCLDTLRKERDS
jgi:hypothetical protein